jgi:hypothetical protein
LRPVIWSFEATFEGLRLLRRLTPAPLRKIPASRLWGWLYLGSFWLAIGYALVMAGPLTRQDITLLVGICLAWWGVWGLITWALLGAPRFWKRFKRLKLP